MKAYDRARPQKKKKKRALRSNNGAIDKTTIATRCNIAASTTLLHCNIPEHKVSIPALHT